MNKKSIKRTYQVRFSSQMKYKIEETTNLDTISDVRFAYLDPISQSYFDAVKSYEKKCKTVFSKEKRTLFAEKNTTEKKLLNEMKDLDKSLEEQQERIRTAPTKKIGREIRNEKGGWHEMYARFRELKHLYDDVIEEACEIVPKKVGDPPSIEICLRPILNRMYWEFNYISFDIPSWIKERDYSVINEEEIDLEQMVQKLERVEPKGSGVNWKSRNRGGNVTVSARGFNKTAPKIYPSHLENNA